MLTKSEKQELSNNPLAQKLWELITKDPTIKFYMAYAKVVDTIAEDMDYISSGSAGMCTIINKDDKMMEKLQKVLESHDKIAKGLQSAKLHFEPEEKSIVPESRAQEVAFDPRKFGKKREVEHNEEVNQEQ